MEYFLLSRLSTNNFFIDVLILFLLIPFVQFLSNHFKTDLPEIIYKCKRGKWSIITFSGWDNLHNGIFYFDYPYPMTAICYLLNKKNLSTNLKYVNLTRNALFFTDQVSNKLNKEININYILDDKENIKLSDDIYIDVITYRMTNPNNENKTNSDINWRVDLSVKSKTLSIEKVKEFIVECVKEFNEFEEKKNANKIYHFIYQGYDENKESLIFSTSILSNLEIESQKNFETFDTLFSENKDSLIKSIDRLKDINYYKRTGIKRKIGYLFYGPPGCGKTSHVVAMANHDNSNIIEIPMSRVKKNKEIEAILNVTNINGINIEKDKLIIFFDEIDQAGKALAKRDGEKTEEEKEKKEDSNTKDLIMMSLLSSKSDNNNLFDKKDDQLNLGCVLSRLDGIGNYNGLKIIAATNCKEKLSPALYRHGRLTPMFFDYCRKEDIINMIEHYYQEKLSEEQKSKIPDKTHQISPATIRKYLEDYEYDLKGLITYLHNKVK